MRKKGRFLEARAGMHTDAHFTHLQQALGMTYHPDALLLDRSLDNVINPCKMYPR